MPWPAIHTVVSKTGHIMWPTWLSCVHHGHACRCSLAFSSNELPLNLLAGSALLQVQICRASSHRETQLMLMISLWNLEYRAEQLAANGCMTRRCRACSLHNCIACIAH